MTRPEDPTSRSEPEDRDLALFVRAVWRRRALVALCVLAGVLVSVVLRQVRPPVYTAAVTILPQSRGTDLGLLGSLAMQGGFPVEIMGGFDESNYGRILTSRRLLKPLLHREWPGHDGHPITLFRVFDVECDTTDRGACRRAETILMDLLRDRAIRFVRDPLNGFIELTVSIPEEPRLAAAMANALAHGLEEYNDRHRTNRAREQRLLVERRLEEVQEELRAASDALAEFVASNRRYAESPVLAREHARLQREVRAREFIWEELMRQFELARIEELQNVLAVEILDEAVVPVMSDRLSLPVAVLVGGLLGGVAALLLLVAGELRRRLLAAWPEA